MRSRQLRQTSVCQFSTCSWSFAEDLARYKNHGFKSIGVWRRKLEDYGIERAIDLLFESRLGVSSLHWAGGFTGDGWRFKDAVNDTVDAIRLAATIDAGCLLVHPGSLNRHIEKHANRIIRAAFEEILPVAEDHGVQLVVEPILDQSDSPWTFHRQLDDTLGLLDDFPNLGVNLDLYHVGLSAPAFERLSEYVNRIKLVQLSDRNSRSLHLSKLPQHRRQSFRLGLGQGEVALGSWLAELERLGFDGAFEVEIHGHQFGESMAQFNLLDQTAQYVNQEATQFEKVASRKVKSPNKRATKTASHNA